MADAVPLAYSPHPIPMRYEPPALSNRPFRALWQTTGTILEGEAPWSAEEWLQLYVLQDPTL